MQRFEWIAFVPSPIDGVWEFFSDPRNLPLLTPPRMRLAVAPGAPVRASARTEVDLRVRVLGVPLRWRSVIEACEPQRYFVDRQTRCA
jgi:ligand-binding SRPBCC domain-containing protein